MAEAVILYVFAGAGDRQRTVIAFGGTVVGAAFALFAYMEGIENDQSKAVDKLFERWNSPTMIQHKDLGRDIRRGVLDPMTLARSSQSTAFSAPAKTQRTDLLGLLSFYEEISLAIRMHSAGEEKLRRFFEPAMVQTYTKVEEFIKRERSVDNVLTYYVEFEEVVRSWKP